MSFVMEVVRRTGQFDGQSGRCSTRTTNRNPDQTSVTAQTLLSTSFDLRQKSRIRFSLRSVAIPDDFFGQQIHRPPAAFSFLDKRSKLVSSVFRSTQKSKMTSKGPLPVDSAAIPERCSSPNFSGAFTKQTRAPGEIPSFFGSGVPEYPTMLRTPFDYRAKTSPVHR